MLRSLSTSLGYCTCQLVVMRLTNWDNWGNDLMFYLLQRRPTSEMEVTHARGRCSKHSRKDFVFFLLLILEGGGGRRFAVLRLELGRRVPMTVQGTRAFLLGFPHPASLLLYSINMDSRARNAATGCCWGPSHTQTQTEAKRRPRPLLLSCILLLCSALSLSNDSREQTRRRRR